MFEIKTYQKHTRWVCQKFWTIFFWTWILTQCPIQKYFLNIQNHNDHQNVFFANRKPLFKHGNFKEKDIFWNPKSKHKISNLFFEFCTHRKNHRHAKFCVSKNLNVDLFFCLKIELKTTFWKNNFKTSDLIWKFTNRKAKHFFSSRDFEKTFWNFEKLLIKPKNENL